jgi:hypothetical protein
MAPRPNMRCVQRYEHHDFCGWLVSLKRAGVIFRRYFSDNGDRRAALRRALRWRDRMMARLPPPRKFKRRWAQNKTGVIGVNVRDGRTRKGTRVRYYDASWVDETGRTRKRTFSVAKYGESRARAMAIRTRKQMLAELLRPGAPYPASLAGRR